jgi:hypothetical protein
VKNRFPALQFFKYRQQTRIGVRKNAAGGLHD